VDESLLPLRETEASIEDRALKRRMVVDSTFMVLVMGEMNSVDM